MSGQVEGRPRRIQAVVGVVMLLALLGASGVFARRSGVKGRPMDSELSKDLAVVGAMYVKPAASTAVASSQPETKAGYLACVTKDALEQAFRAVNEKDDRAMAYLLKSSCIQPRAGLPLTIVENGIMSVRIRLYAGDSAAAELWAPREIVQFPAHP